MCNVGVKVNGIWVQDWFGICMIFFGKCVMWNWKWNSDNYLQLDSCIKQWKEEGVQFFFYINLYVVSDKDFCVEVVKYGYLVKDVMGGDYLVEFGEFYGGVVDLINFEVYDWFKDVIKKNMIVFGCSGWMVDFGEYLLIDMYLYNGVSVEIMYNVWFVLWVKCNYEVLQEIGKFGEILFFMCVGYIGSQKYFIMMWVGDQNVDWSFDDGLVFVVFVVLLLVMIGYGLYYSDIGGYIILFDMKCSKELLLCWCDFSVFMLMMCIYEGNCFGDNWQFDGDVEIIVYFVCMIIVFIMLKLYFKQVVV